MDIKNKTSLMKQALRWNKMEINDVAEESAYGITYLKDRFDFEVGRGHLIFNNR